MRSDCRSVPPVSPPSANATAAPFAYERRQVFSTNESTVVEEGQQDQQVRGQVCEFAVPSFILLPTLFDTHFVVVHTRAPAREISGQRRVLQGCGGERLLDEGSIAFASRLEGVDFCQRTSLSAIHGHRAEEHR